MQDSNIKKSMKSKTISEELSATSHVKGKVVPAILQLDYFDSIRKEFLPSFGARFVCPVFLSPEADCYWDARLLHQKGFQSDSR